MTTTPHFIDFDGAKIPVVGGIVLFPDGGLPLECPTYESALAFATEFGLQACPVVDIPRAAEPPFEVGNYTCDAAARSGRHDIVPCPECVAR
jgi:hypothetical protein